MNKRALYLAFALALILIPVSHTNAGDDYCPGGQMSCQRSCQTTYDRCQSACWQRNPNNELLYEQCEMQCSTNLTNCQSNCSSLWGCYEAY